MIRDGLDTNRDEMRRRLQRWLAHDRLPLGLAALATALLLPSLWIGFQMDDLFHRTLLLGDGPPEMNAWQIFSGPPADPELHRAFVDRGIFPWWVSDGFRLSLFRPLSVLTARIDYWLWPDSPLLMHLQNLVWFGALIGAVAVLYRRLMAPAWVAGLAALLYAIDDTHAPPAAWIANRNVLLACLFGVLCLIAHDRWRREGARAAAWLAPLFLAAALASGEAALATAGYLFAYAACLEGGSWRRRAASLLPAAGVSAMWAGLYVAGDYGAHGSGMYVDPVGSPGAFARALAERAPLALLGQWSPVPADLGTLLPPASRPTVWWLALALTAALALLLWPLVRGERRSRFWLVGMLLSLVPISAVFPSNRLLFFVGLGAMPLLASWLAGVWEGAPWLPTSNAWKAPAKVAAVALAIVHLPLALVTMAIGPWTLRQTGLPMTEAAATLPADPTIASQELVLWNAPDYLTFVTHIPTIQQLENRPAPRRVRALSSGPTAVEVERLDESTLRVLIDRGLYAGPLGQLFRDQRDELQVGDRIAIAGLDAGIAGLDARGDPDEIVYSFDSPLEDRSRRWIGFVDGGWVELEPPAIGETMRLEAPKGPLDLFY